MKISIKQPQKRFEEHLSQDLNNRILFSGKFGTGKSHFLREFFDENNDKYNEFSLSPVNYVVGANQDIFEWIKVDIAKCLLANYIPKERSAKLSKNFLIQSYLYQHTGELFQRLILNVLNTLGEKKTKIDVLDTFKKDVENFEEFQNNATEEFKTSYEKIAKIIKDSTQISGSIFEDDLTTNVIRANIELLKYKTKKESVLIIDDLDRLDPEHIFRILNILSCHNNHFESDKFGFQKIILVCDYNNIREIYKHKYGSNTDFDGYIEKFYSFEPFHYSLDDAIVTYCRELNFQNLSSNSQNILLFLLKVCCRENLIKVRSLKKVSSFIINSEILPLKMYEIESYKKSVASFFDNDDIMLDYNKFDFLKVLYVFINLTGGIENFKLLLSSLKDVNYPIETEQFNSILYEMVILSQLAKGYISDGMIFYTKTVDHYSKILEYMENPKYAFYDRKVEVQLKWDSRNKYDSKCHYFSGARFNIWHSSELSTSSQMRISDFIKELRLILNFAVKEKIFTNISR